MKRPYILVVLFVVMAFFQLAVFLYIVSDYDKRRNKFEVTQSMFVLAVDQAVSNFVSRLTRYTPDTTNSTPVSSVTDPYIIFVDSLGTWETYSGRSFCDLDGVTYQTGDYSPYGLITRIVPNRVYTLLSNRVSIVRARRPRAVISPARSAPDDGAQE